MEGRLSTTGMDGRPSLAGMDGRPSTMLVRRNREIAEVREETLRMDSRLDAAQAVNAVLLEEKSVLDSNVTAQCARSAISEQRLAELFYQAESAEQELCRQQTAHRAAFSVLQEEAIEQKGRLAKVEAEADIERDRTADVGADLGMLQSRLHAEEETLAQIRLASTEDLSALARASCSTGDAATSGAVAARAQALEDELRAINAQQESQRNESASSKRRITELRDSLLAERQRRDTFSNELRAAVAEQAGDPGRLQALEARVAARGGNASSLLEGVRSGHGEHNAEREAAGRRTAELRDEIRSSEEQLQSLQVSLERTRERNVEDETRDRAKLDNARSQLQRSIVDTAEAHGKEVTNLEDDIMIERQKATEDSLAEMACVDQIAQLQQTRLRLETERSSVGAQTQTDAGHCATLRAELIRLRAEVQSVEMRTGGLKHCQADCDHRKLEALTEEEQQTAKLRGMLEELWRGLSAAKISAGCSY